MGWDGMGTDGIGWGKWRSMSRCKPVGGVHGERRVKQREIYKSVSIWNAGNLGTEFLRRCDTEEIGFWIGFFITNGSLFLSQYDVSTLQTTSSNLTR